MAEARRPALHLIKTHAPVMKEPEKPRTRGSAVLIEVDEHGHLCENHVKANTQEDAMALLSALTLALIHIVRASQGFL